VVVGATVVVSAEVVVVEVVEVVVSSSAALLPHAVNKQTTAMPEASPNKADLGAPREVIQRRLPVPATAKTAISRARPFRP
jgi:hypothetical protein